VGTEYYHYPRVSSKVDLRNIINSESINTNKELLRFTFRLSEESQRYERKVYDVINLMEDVGGFSTSLLFIGKAVFTFFSLPLYFSSLIEKLYFFKKSKQTKKKKFDPEIFLKDIEADEMNSAHQLNPSK